jgi:Zn-dependent alcohol dehydrogenase
MRKSWLIAVKKGGDLCSSIADPTAFTRYCLVQVAIIAGIGRALRKVNKKSFQTVAMSEKASAKVQAANPADRGRLIVVKIAVAAFSLP